MSKLELRLLGGYEGRIAEGLPLELPTKKAWALLAYLALRPGRPARREQLATLLWGERFDEQARRSLRQTVYELRGALGDGFADRLSATRDAVALGGEGLAVDALRFEELAATGRPADLAEAEALYGGPLLDGLEIGEAGFDEWLAGERARLQELACRALEASADHHLEQGDHDGGIESARRLIQIDPYREEAHRLLMRGLAAQGRRSEALKQFQELEGILKADLGAAPDANTVELRDRLRNGPELPRPTPTDPKRAARSENRRPKKGGPSRRWWAMAMAVALFAVIIVGTWWRPWVPTVEPASVENMAFPLPKKPSVAVLPFDNLSGNAEQEPIVDGFTEDLITALSKVPHLFVISRRSTFSYKGKQVKVRQVAEELGVRYVVEGSVRRAGGTIRVNVQLIDAVNGRHVWAERYDRKVEDLFAVQDDIIRRVLVALHITLTDGENARIAGRGTRSLEAWLLRIQGMAAAFAFTREGALRGRQLFEAAHKADPEWGRMLAAIAWTHWIDARYGYSKSRTESIRLGVGFAKRAIKMDPRDPLGYMQLGNLRRLQGRFVDAVALREKAAELAPNDFNAIAGLACMLNVAGQSARALHLLERAQRLSPRYPWWTLQCLGFALLLEKQHDRAITVFREAVRRKPRFANLRVLLAAVYADIGRLDEARAAAAAALKLDPELTVARSLKVPVIQDPKRTAWYRGLLLKAGLPEE